MEYISDNTISKMNRVVNDNLEQLTNFKGMSTDIVWFFVNLVPVMFKAHRSWINAIVVREEPLFWKVLDLLFFGPISLFIFASLSALWVACAIVTLPLALVFDGVPSVFSKNYRNSANFARKIRHLNMILQKSIKYSNLDIKSTKTQKHISNLCFRMNPLDDKKVDKLIKQIEHLFGKLNVHKNQGQQYKIEQYYEPTSINTTTKQKPMHPIVVEQKELYQNITKQEDNLEM